MTDIPIEQLMAADVMSDKPAVSKKDGAPEQKKEQLVEPDVFELENKAEKILKETAERQTYFY